MNIYKRLLFIVIILNLFQRSKLIYDTGFVLKCKNSAYNMKKGQYQSLHNLKN